MGTDGQSPSYELASVLFMDIVSYSLRSIDDQTEVLTTLQKIVRESAEYQQASAKQEVLSLPTGDGMALVFLRDPIAPARCALEVAKSLQSHPELKLRMGLHQGPVRRHADIKEDVNVVGGGINIAQRVMDYGDAKGDAYVIFPTLRTRGGDNHVTPGMVVEIPAPSDKPSYFKVERSRPDQINEVLTFLISPKPLVELKIGRERLKVGDDQLSRWEKQWKAKSYKLEDAAQEGKVYTLAEKEAARGEKLLTRDDPLPQTMYRVDCKAGDAVMLEVPLKIAK